MDQPDVLIVCRRVIAGLTANVALSCDDLATLAPYLGPLDDWQEWLRRRRNSALHVQRTPAQRTELLAALIELAASLDSRS